MSGRILVPTSLSLESNSIFPWALTIAQAFATKLYLLHVMDPDSVNEPERLEDFPRVADFLKHNRDQDFQPPLKAAVPVAKLYIYHRDIPKVILNVAKAKNVDLICLSAIRAGANFAWWSAGHTIETVLKSAPCSVLCVRGRPLKPEQWQRPRVRHMLLLTELNGGTHAALEKVLPWVQRFNAILHVFPLGDLRRSDDKEALRQLCHADEIRTNVLLFAKRRPDTENLLRFIADTPVNLIIMTPNARKKFTHRLFSDVFVRLLRVTDVPVLLLR
jgi:nucleotide-binding universal stress UspA family protein